MHPRVYTHTHTPEMGKDSRLEAGEKPTEEKLKPTPRQLTWGIYQAMPPLTGHPIWDGGARGAQPGVRRSPDNTNPATNTTPTPGFFWGGTQTHGGGGGHRVTPSQTWCRGQQPPPPFLGSGGPCTPTPTPKTH